MTTRTPSAHELAGRASAEPILATAGGALFPSVRARRHRGAHDQPVLSIRASVPETGRRFIADALHDVRIYMQEHRVQPAGPPFSIRRRTEREIDIEAGWPTTTQLPAPAASTAAPSRAPSWTRDL